MCLTTAAIMSGQIELHSHLRAPCGLKFRFHNLAQYVQHQGGHEARSVTEHLLLWTSSSRNCSLRPFFCAFSLFLNMSKRSNGLHWSSDKAMQRGKELNAPTVYVRERQEQHYVRNTAKQ